MQRKHIFILITHFTCRKQETVIDSLIQTLDHTEIGLASRNRSEINQIVDQAYLFGIDEFHIGLKHIAHLHLPPWLNIDADREFGQEIHRIRFAKQFR